MTPASVWLDAVSPTDDSNRRFGGKWVVEGVGLTRNPLPRRTGVHRPVCPRPVCPRDFDHGCLNKSRKFNKMVFCGGRGSKVNFVTPLVRLGAVFALRNPALVLARGVYVTHQGLFTFTSPTPQSRCSSPSQLSQARSLTASTWALESSTPRHGRVCTPC